MSHASKRRAQYNNGLPSTQHLCAACKLNTRSASHFAQEFTEVSKQAHSGHPSLMGGDPLSVLNLKPSYTQGAAMYRLELGCICSFCFCLLLCLACLQGCQGQAYHFSHGWFPGRKRSAPVSEKSSLLSEFPTSHGYAPIRSQKSSEIMDFFQYKRPIQRDDTPSTFDKEMCRMRPHVQQMIQDLINVGVQLVHSVFAQQKKKKVSMQRKL